MKRNKTLVVYSDSWIYSFLFFSLIIIWFVLFSMYFTIFGIKFNSDLLVVPFIFCVSNYISKKYGYRDALRVFNISILIVFLIFIMLFYLFPNLYLIDQFIRDVSALIISCFFNLISYNYLKKNKVKIINLSCFLSFLIYLLINFIFK